MRAGGRTGFWGEIEMAEQKRTFSTSDRLHPDDLGGNRERQSFQFLSVDFAPWQQEE